MEPALLRHHPLARPGPRGKPVALRPQLAPQRSQWVFFPHFGQRPQASCCQADFPLVRLVPAPVFAGRQLTSAPESTSMSTNSPSRALGTPIEQISSPALLDSEIPSLTLPRLKQFPIAPTMVGVLAAWIAGGQIFHSFLGHWDRGPFSSQFQHVFLTGPALLPPFFFSYRLPLPWAAVFQKIDTLSPDDRLFHMFGTSCRSEGSLLKCDQCFHLGHACCV